MGLFDSQKAEWAPIVELPTGNSDTLNNLQKISMGAGSSRFEANIKDGLWMGADTFATAPFNVDFLGNLLATSVTIKNSAGTVLIDSNSTTLDFVQVLNSTLNTSSKTILGDFTFTASDYAGAFKTGDIAWSASTGLPVSGTGGVFNAKGLIFAKEGVPTITLDGTTGDATFAGTVAGASGTFGTVTAGTFTGCTFTGNTFQSALTDLRLVLDATQYVKWYNSTDQIASVGVLPTTDKLTITADGGVTIAADGSGDVIFLAAGTGGLYATSTGVIDFNASNNFSITCDDLLFYYNDDNDGSDCKWYSNGSPTMLLEQNGDLATSGKIQCGDTFESSDGSDGQNESFEVATSFRFDGSQLQWKARLLTFKDGILTNKGSESDWRDIT